ncbi:MAG: hypothetical protein U0324_24995 [Polyangiales bacterium]
MSDDLYARFGRQIALPELGAEGQRALAQTPVDLTAWPTEAAALHQRAGGANDPSGMTIDRPAWSFTDRAGDLGAGAWAAVEAARRVLGLPPATMPTELLERLGGIPR